MVVPHTPAPAPLPNRPYSSTWSTADGTPLILRPVCPDDVAHTLHFIDSLSYSARYFRFGRGDFRLDESEARCLCSPNLAQCADFLVLAEVHGHTREIASGRYCLDSDGLSAEFALVVADAWQGQGIARRLMQTLIDSATRNGLARLYGRILATNRPMIALAHHLGFTSKHTDSRAVVEVERLLSTSANARLRPTQTFQQ